MDFIQIFMLMQEKMAVMDKISSENMWIAGMENRSGIYEHVKEEHNKDSKFIVEYNNLTVERKKEVRKLCERKNSIDKKITELIEKASNEDDSSRGINKDHKIAGYPSPTV